MESRRVVVTGLGTVNPLSKDVEGTWDAIKAGRSGLGPITLFDAAEFPAKIAGEVKDFDPSVWMEKREARKLARFTQFAMASSVMAMEDAGFDKGGFDPERMSVIIGNGIGGVEVTEECIWGLSERGLRGVSPMSIPKLIMNEAPANVAIHFGILGPSYCICTACASATDAIGASYNAIRYGNTDVSITGGVEAAITQFGIAGFVKLTALSTKYNDNPAAASRPFDKDRDGFVMGEGAGILILEDLDHALKRNAKIYGEVAGYGMSCDAYHITSPDSKGDGPARAMKWALEDAGMKPEEIDYFNAHGTSTPINDPLETIAIKKAFGEYAHKLPISSTKSMTAHLVGGAGGIESIISLLAMRDGFIPPTINLDNPDPECDLDYVPNTGRSSELTTVMTDNLGFGGHNGVLIFKKFKN